MAYQCRWCGKMSHSNNQPGPYAMGDCNGRQGYPHLWDDVTIEVDSRTSTSTSQGQSPFIKYWKIWVPLFIIILIYSYITNPQKNNTNTSTQTIQQAPQENIEQVIQPEPSQPQEAPREQEQPPVIVPIDSVTNTDSTSSN